VAGIAASNDAIGRSRESSSTEIKREGHDAATIDVRSVSPNFFNEYGISPRAGRLFDAEVDKQADTVPLVINEIAARQLGFASPDEALGQPVMFKGIENEGPGIVTKRIVGIAPEIRFHSLREPPAAVAYELSRGADVTLTVRASGSIADAERATREVWSQYYPNSVLEITPAREIYAANYADDVRLGRLLQLSTIIAMLIAAFGAYVLSADAVQRRTREIALRKLFGAGRADIGLLVAKEVGAIVAIASMIAVPLAAMGIARYLAPYTERTPMAYWSLALAFVASLAVAMVAVARQVRIAIRMPPARALRT
jgi:hypothetical protein